VNRTPLIAGNWKMHGTRSEALGLAGALAKSVGRTRGREVVLAPPFTALDTVSQAIAGSIVMETLFQLPGMGSLLVEALAHRDFPMFQTLVLFLALIVMAVNLLVDLTYFAIDPRTRAQVG